MGPWKVFSATRKAGTAGGPNLPVRTSVSVWTCSPGKGAQRAKVVEQLKRSVTTLSRLRHPCILEIVEPVEESRGEVLFATEPVLATLASCLGSKHPDFQVDEIETQKGLLQIARALEFLHDTQLIHTNLTPQAILINTKGDWKLGGVEYLTNLAEQRGSWALEDIEDTLPIMMQRTLEYMDPAYLLDRHMDQSNDMFSLGVVFFAILHDGATPYNTRGRLNTVRTYAEQLPSILRDSRWTELGSDVRCILENLISRTGEGRYTARTFQTLPYFHNLLVSVLQFLERDSFVARSREEQVQFLRGLLKLLPKFSTALLRRKLLPSMTTDRRLLPYVLPNIFYVAQHLCMWIAPIILMTAQPEFRAALLPRLVPLMTQKDPPQTQNLFVAKMSAAAFRDDIMPLFYSAFENEHIAVQENALQKVPRLCGLLDYSHVKDVLLPKLVSLFSKTTTLSVKVGSLIAFHALVPVLESHAVAETLVPTLARIKTREPSVMIASLAVYEAASPKVSREIRATQILPRLWVMSMCPELNETQFARFMCVIREVGDAVEREQMAHLRETHSLRRHTDAYVASETPQPSNATSGGDINLEALVGHARSNDLLSTEDPLDALAEAVPKPSVNMQMNDPLDDLFGASVTPTSPQRLPPPLQPMKQSALQPTKTYATERPSPARPFVPPPGPRTRPALGAVPRQNPASSVSARHAQPGASTIPGLFDALVPDGPPVQSRPQPPPSSTGGVLQPAKPHPAWAAFDPLG